MSYKSHISRSNRHYLLHCLSVCLSVCQIYIFLRKASFRMKLLLPHFHLSKVVQSEKLQRGFPLADFPIQYSFTYRQQNLLFTVALKKNVVLNKDCTGVGISVPEQRIYRFKPLTWCCVTLVFWQICALFIWRHWCLWTLILRLYDKSAVQEDEEWCHQCLLHDTETCKCLIKRRTGKLQI